MGSPQTGHKPCLLLVDDDERWRDILQHFLELNGFAVTPAGSGSETLQQLQRGHPDAILLDLRLPGMDGLVVLGKIRALLPATPIIVITQVDEDHTKAAAAAAGATAYVLKPFNFEELRALLSATFRR